ncbi:MAG: hypothetical protein LLG00_16670 [Planctomycetaceae bacterium]|nr:hypothetical protein [Planctomycetaceae bacterium]
MAETAEHVNINAGGSGESEWGKMTPDERAQEVEEGVAAAREAYEARAVGTGEYVPPVEDTERKPAEDDADDETQDIPEADDETPVGDDAADAGDTAKGEGEKGDPEPAAWLDDETRDLADAMGLTDDDLAEFGSREELERALRIIDRRAFEAGKAQATQTADGQGSATTDPSQAAEKPGASKAKQASGDPGDPFADLSQFKLGETFDEEAAAPINRFIETAVGTIRDLQTRLGRFEAERQRQAVADVRRRALDSLHAMGNTELFGKPGAKPTKEQAANIEKALDAHFTHARGLIAQGRKVAPTPAFLKAAVHLAFGDQLSQQQQRQLSEKLRNQSARRMGGGAAKALPRARGARATADEVREDPDLDKLFNDLVAENRG